MYAAYNCMKQQKYQGRWRPILSIQGMIVGCFQSVRGKATFSTVGITAYIANTVWLLSGLMASQYAEQIIQDDVFSSDTDNVLHIAGLVIIKQYHR